MTENTQTLLRQLAELLDQEKRAELPPERADLIEQWAGKKVHILLPMVVFGDFRRRGEEVVLTAEMIAGTIDRKGNSVLDRVPNGSIGVGPVPDDLTAWIDDSDPVREAMYREAVEQLKANGVTAPPAWRAVHYKYATTKRRAEMDKEDREREAQRVKHWGIDS